MTETDSCFRCRKPLGENPKGIILMYPGRETGEGPLYTLPRMYCKECINSFYQWSTMLREETVMQRALRLSRENSHYGLDGRKKE